MKKSTSAKTNFETSLASLERIVREMERGDLPLEKSLELFEQGVQLSRECQARLSEAERRIEILLRDAEGRAVVEPLDAENMLTDGRGSLLKNDEFDEDEDDDEAVF